MPEHSISPQHADLSTAQKTTYGAQWWLLFAIMVANKPADRTVTKLQGFLGPGHRNLTPFSVVRDYAFREILGVRLRGARTGQYNRIERALQHVINSDVFPDDPRDAHFQQIQAIPGVGPKTSRWYWQLIHPDARVAALDTHILKFLRDCGTDAPMATPPEGPKYERLEQRFLAVAHQLGFRPAELDYVVWRIYRAGWQILADGVTQD